MTVPIVIDAAAAAVLLEAIMLICFGLAWPIANLRMLRIGRAEGKGMAFTMIILCGHLAGAVAKLALVGTGVPLPPLFWLYALNAASVGINLALQWHFSRNVSASTMAISARATAGSPMRAD